MFTSTHSAYSLASHPAGVTGVVLATVVCAGVVFALMDPGQWDHAFDFRLLWLAGSTWQHGYSPYMPEFDALYAAQLGGGQASWHVFNYPPYFAPVALALAALPYDAAVAVWLAINVICVSAAAAVLSSLWAATSLRSRVVVYVGTLVFALTSYAGGYSLFYGQTSLLVLLGACLVLKGYAERSALLLAVGLVLLSLKPNVGLLPGVLVALSVYDFQRRRWQPWALVPVLVTVWFVLFGSGLAIAIAGFDATVGGFAARIAAYSATPPSATDSLTGFAYLVDTASGLSVPLWLTLALAALVTALLVRPRRDRALAMCTVLAATFFFVPLHTYDLVATVSLVPLLWLAGLPRACLAALGLVVIHRCVNLVWEVNPRTWFDDGLLPATVGTLLLLVVCAGARDAGRRRVGAGL